jgi:mxaJ protein
MARPAHSVARMLWLAGALALLAAARPAWSAGSAEPAAADRDRELRVCADPDNLPFSNEALGGFENKIAQIVADDMKAVVRYTWHPQRRGFIRRTLKAGECDLVMGVPKGYDPVLVTKRYYRSSYVFVYAKSKSLHLSSFDDPALREMKIGLHAFGDDGANSPAALALGRRGMTSNIVGFTILATDDSPPGRIIDAVANGEIDVAIVWGPFAGYFAKRQSIDLEVTAVSPSADDAGLPFAYDMAMGVRRRDTAFKTQVEGAIDRRRGEIRAVLEDYGVPLLDAAPVALRQQAGPETNDGMQ